METIFQLTLGLLILFAISFVIIGVSGVSHNEKVRYVLAVLSYKS